MKTTAVALGFVLTTFLVACEEPKPEESGSSSSELQVTCVNGVCTQKGPPGNGNKVCINGVCTGDSTRPNKEKQEPTTGGNTSKVCINGVCTTTSSGGIGDGGASNEDDDFWGDDTWKDEGEGGSSVSIRCFNNVCTCGDGPKKGATCAGATSGKSSSCDVVCSF